MNGTVVEEAMRKADVLIEALPFLKQFHHALTVVKIGGEAIEDAPTLRALLTDLVFLEQVGLRPILVHGGGASISRALTAAGIEVVWNQGRRVTTPEAMEIVAREVERLNLHLVDQLFELGGAAVGLVPSRHFCIVHGEIHDPALGEVGAPVAVDRQRLTSFTSRGLIPVVPPLSLHADARILNTNADDIALSVATAMGAAKLVFCSSVPGVLREQNDPASRIPTLRREEVRSLVDDGTISGGMIPKVESCLAALEAGVAKIHIVHAATAHALLLEIFTAEGVGTELVADAPATTRRVRAR
ncbi:MAG: acetylglutamate kinase [Planctomycetota bacterium]